ncbi:MAG: Gfo/Idh/MocA family oxidoreductase [Dehalococcoidia bacterium]
MRLGLYGCGNRSRHLVKSVAGEVRVTACYDADPARAQQTAETHGGRAYDALDAFLEASEVDAFVVSLFPRHHAEAARRVAATGKSMYLEKPIGVSSAEAEAVVEAVREHKVVCHVGFLHRYVPVFERLTQMIDAGELGELLGVNIDWLTLAGAAVRGEVDNWRGDPATGGELVQHLGHTLDLLRVWGGDIERVCAMSHRALWPKSPSENQVSALMRYRECPAIVNVQQSLVSHHYMNKGRVEGSEATVEYEWWTESVIRVYRCDGETGPPGLREPSRVIGDLEPYAPGGATDGRMMRDFLAAARGERPVAVTAEDGLAALRLSEAIRRSADTGEPVMLD